MEEENKQIAEEQPEKKTRRKRRTKAEIEADNAAKATEKQKSEAGMAFDSVDHAHVISMDSNNDTVHEQNTNSLYELKKDANGDVNDNVNCKDTEHRDEDEKLVSDSDKCDSTKQTGALIVGSGSYLATANVYEAPYRNGFCKLLKAVFEPKAIRNGFVQVAYMKTGLGMVTGYIKQDEAKSIFNK